MLFLITTGSSNPYTPPLYSTRMAFQDNSLTWNGVVFRGRKIEYYMGVKYVYDTRIVP